MVHDGLRPRPGVEMRSAPHVIPRAGPHGRTELSELRDRGRPTGVAALRPAVLVLGREVTPARLGHEGAPWVATGRPRPRHAHRTWLG
eukprot:scaffold46816_cov66-Phaeocystis_antarctica.AAC.3